MDEKEFDYLNVIPLVDVMLVLLTIVLTTSTFIATGGIEVQLPKAEASCQPTDVPPKTVVIDREGRLWLDGNPVSMEGLTSALNAIDRQTPVLVRADKSLALQGFVDVFAALKQQGFNQLSLQTQQQP
jgi:biopolymer transport protein ExbD